MFKDIISQLENRKKLVFLGGTCNGSKWRDHIIPKLKIDYFNPVVEEWTEECKQKEIEMRNKADYLLYVITPAMKGVYSIAEAVDDSNKKPQKTIFCYIEIDKVDGETYVFDQQQLNSLTSVGTMIQNNGGKWLKSLDEVINYLNGNN